MRISFKARNEIIRKADDVQRKARQTFPLISSTYVDDFYISASENRHEEKNYKARNISDRLYSKLYTARNIADYPDCYGIKFPNIEKETPYAILLNYVKQLKTGNCKECAAAALAALTANGFYDSKRVNLFLKTEYVNKKTGDVEYSQKDSLDHSFVITSMGKNSDKEKDLVIVDNWMGFSDSISGAKSKFKQIYNDTLLLKEITARNKSFFRLEKAKADVDVNFDDYELRQNFVFVPSDSYTTHQLKQLGMYARIMFDSLLLKKS